MKRVACIFLLALFAVAVAVTARADDLSVKAVIEPPVVPVGAEATLIIRINGKFRRSSEPQLPDLPEFTVYKGGTSQSFSFINGKRSASLEFTYVLVPKKEGRYIISPIRFEAGGKIYSAEPVTIEVVKSSAHLAPPSAGDDAPAVEGAGSPIFITALVDRDTVYVNQQITWTLGFYTDGSVDMLRSPQYTPPTAEGFWVEDLPPQKNYYQVINNSKYLVNEIKRGFFPTVPGQYKIGSARVDIVVDDFSARGFDDFFRRRRGTFGFGDTKSLVTEELPITVLPLPTEGRPANFSGLVGRGLDMSVRADKQVLEAGEPVNVTLEITGEGNFKTMAAPTIPELQGFKIYESGSSSDLFKKDYLVAGRKRTDLVLIPKHEGETTIPSIQLSYFDPIDEVYKMIRSAPIRMTVKPGAKEGGGRQIIFAGSGEDIEVLGKDINFIHPVPAVLHVDDRQLYRNGFVLGLHALPLLAVLASLAVERRRRRWRDNVPLARATRAARVADKRLKAATQQVKDGQHGVSVATVSTALREYFADKMNDAVAGLTVDRIEDFLAARGVDGELREQLGTVLNKCDSVQYAPAAVTGEQAAATIDEATAVITRLERELS